jgi:hypothetical protein
MRVQPVTGTSSTLAGLYLFAHHDIPCTLELLAFLFLHDTMVMGQERH